ncbi:unnamed protein product [Amoebophrya sp. A120]|nr:unnamed protein product [Amoebophrya sp. A120]|eukprot:GSA120T00012049001.1
MVLAAFTDTNFLLGVCIALLCTQLVPMLLRTIIATAGKNTKQAVATISGTKELKMVMIVRKDLGMQKGKIAAQCGHAVLGAYEKAQADKDRIRVWRRWGQAKIALQCQDEEQMMKLEKEARRRGLNYYTVTDAGRTQIAPNTKTVLAIGPEEKDVLDELTGDLKLL